MEAINLKAEASKIKELYEYKTIAKMNSHIFTLDKSKNRTLEFHILNFRDRVLSDHKFVL